MRHRNIDRYSANNSLSNARLTIDRVLTVYRPTVDRYIDRVSTDYRPLYQPIDRLTLPTVNMIQIICFPVWTSTFTTVLELFEDRFFSAKALLLIRFLLNEIPSSGFDSSFTLPSIASSPYQVISGTNVHNSPKYTTTIQASSIISTSF